MAGQEVQEVTEKVAHVSKSAIRMDAVRDVSSAGESTSLMSYIGGFFTRKLKKYSREYFVFFSDSKVLRNQTGLRLNQYCIDQLETMTCTSVGTTTLNR